VISPVEIWAAIKPFYDNS